MANLEASPCARSVCFKKPRASSLNFRLSAVGSGTDWYPCFIRVSADQPRRMTTITVVICITRSAFSLDSWMPLVFCHQK